jgi:hypothetical protein
MVIRSWPALREEILGKPPSLAGSRKGMLDRFFRMRPVVTILRIVPVPRVGRWARLQFWRTLLLLSGGSPWAGERPNCSDSGGELDSGSACLGAVGNSRAWVKSGFGRGIRSRYPAGSVVQVSWRFARWAVSVV